MPFKAYNSACKYAETSLRNIVKMNTLINWNNTFIQTQNVWTMKVGRREKKKDIISTVQGSAVEEVGVIRQ